MFEADRVFPRQDKQGAQTSPGEKRLIVTTSRRRGSGVSTSRVVEVVHVRRGMPRPAEDHPPPAPRHVSAETWLDGFRAKSTLPVPQQNIQPVAPEPVQPTVHVMPMWEPVSQPPVQPEAKPAEPPVETAIVEPRRPRVSKASTPKTAARQFADPFADDDSGANCIRCGYLVEPAREKRGLMTCSQCG